MGWSSAVRKPVATPRQAPMALHIERANVDIKNVVTIDFETYWDADYTLSKLSTSEYVRDERFKAHMAGIKIGRGKTKVVAGSELKAAFAKIDWRNTDVLCHNTAFDGFILSTHFGIVPRRYFDTLCLARGLHGNDIRADLNTVAEFYGKGSKKQGVLIQSKGVKVLPPPLYKEMALYCAQDVDLTFEIFEEMLKDYPAKELDLIDLTIRMFCDPVLKVDTPRVRKELAREIEEKENMLLSLMGSPADQTKLITMRGRNGALEFAKKLVSGNNSFLDMMRDLGLEPPMKLSPTNPGKVTPALAMTDRAFVDLLQHPDPRVRALVECRMSVKSTTNETRAARFLKAGENDQNLPILLLYYGAHTGRFSGGNKMNPQNLTRGGELRKSILAPKGHHICVADSGQIEARITAWLAGQVDLLEDFRKSDAYNAKQALLPKEKRKVARGDDRDPYCKFADEIYGREITKKDDTERFVGKTCILGLGFQMGGPRLQYTLSLGINGPAVFMELNECYRLVDTYRRKNDKIKALWKLCELIIGDMHAGRTGSYKCLSWAKNTVYLPNGMALKYPGLRKKTTIDDNTEWSYLRKGEESKIYGGLLCENIVQALARIVVTDQMLEINKQYRVVTMTHDEVVTVAPIKEAKKCFKFMLKAMSTPPHWCQDIPLVAEGGHDVNYSK